MTPYQRGTSAESAPHANGRMNGVRDTQRPHAFDDSLFMFHTDAPSPVSQPLQSAIPDQRTPPTNRTKHETYRSSPSFPQRSPLSNAAGDTPGTDSSYSVLSPNNSFLDPRSSSSPGAFDGVSGYSGNTTPGFDTLDDLPDIDAQPLFEMTDAPPVTNTARNSTASSGYPPSPRLTASPNLGHTAVHSSPIVKIEYSTPEANHPSPMSHQQSSSSSSSGMGGDGATIRRGDDGSWQGGINPTFRGREFLPFSIKEQEIERKKQEKNAEVEEWLKRSARLLPPQNSKNGGLAAPGGGVRRRARSFADFRSSIVMEDGKLVGPGESSAGRTGVLIDEDERYDYDDDDDDDSSIATGWREGSLDEPYEPPVTEEELRKAEEENQQREQQEQREREQRERELDPAFEPNPKQFFHRAPWTDIAGPATRGASMAMRSQPHTANAAMQKFKQYAENIETASRVATFGSNMTKGRRNSTGNADKILGGPLKRLSFGKKEQKERDGLMRKPSMWGEIRTSLKRSLSTAGDKDKEKEKDKEKLSSPTSRLRGNSFNSLASSPFAAARLAPSFANPSLTVRTTGVGSAFAQMASPLMAAGAGEGSHAATSPPPSRAGSAVAGVVDRIRRNRSKSDLQRGLIFGVVSTMVGPALPASPSPLSAESEPSSARVEKKFTFSEDTTRRGALSAQKLLSPTSAGKRRGEEDEDEDMDDDCISPSGSRVTPEPPRPQLPKISITPTQEGFAAHTRTLTPSLPNKLVDRIAHEQCKRFKKLVDHRQKHLAHLNTNGACPNGAKCRKVKGAIGVGSDGVVGVTGHKRGNNSFDGDIGYDSSSENGDLASPTDGNVAAAQFPPGVPTPPVSRLPAEFECPICFKTKKFNKPSDWTKHVHEDVQPFTCTFPDCTEPKSFKRKADWVRHENERHRHLEWWTCNQIDCTHTCFRKDNFVQHLVREHKMHEPKVKARKSGKEAGGVGPSQAEMDRVWQIVDACHQETTKPPGSEQCRFCGNVCSTWKKLTVHLARHMEAISLPVLELIRDDAVVPAPTRGPRRQAIPQQRIMPPQPQRVNTQHVPTLSVDSNHNHSHSHSPLIRSATSPDGSFDQDEIMTPYSQAPPIPNYNLSPPQPLSRAHSVPREAAALGATYLHTMAARPAVSPSMSIGYPPSATTDYYEDEDGYRHNQGVHTPSSYSHSPSGYGPQQLPQQQGYQQPVYGSQGTYGGYPLPTGQTAFTPMVPSQHMGAQQGQVAYMVPPHAGPDGELESYGYSTINGIS